MEIKNCISNSFQTVQPYEGIHMIEGMLLEKEYLVVIDDDKYLGILTTCDLVKHPHKIVIDCLTEKEHISSDETIISVLDKFKKNQCSALPVFQENRFVGIIEKYGLINELKLKINDLYNKALISENVKSAFLSNLSHEIRTPLNGLLGFLEIVSKLNPEEFKVEGESHCDIIRSCADRFLLIMNDLIDLSLIDSGDDIKILRENIRIEDLFSDLKEFFETASSILNKKVSIQYINPDTSLTILSDGKRIKHILYHLIDNAIKFSNDGKVKFGYEIKNQNIVFFVTNNGSQISKGEKNNMFKAFYKQYTRNDEISDGLGLGLPLVKKMSELLGGTVDFVSNETETTFYVTLPLSAKAGRLDHIWPIRL